MSTPSLPIESPAGYVPASAVAFADPDGGGVIVSAATPLPVMLAGAGARGLGALRLLDPPALHPAPPRFVRRTSSTPLIPDADALVIDRRDPRLTPCSAPLVQVATGFPWDDFSRGGWIGAGAGVPPFAAAWGVRFLTDSPQVELRVVQPGSLRLLVDGQPTSVAAGLAVPASDPDGWMQPGIDFGADVQTIHPRFVLAAGGTGYVEGDVLSVAGSGGDPLRLLVTAVRGGAIDPDGLAVADWGALTGLQAGAVAATGGSGTGASVTLTDDLGGVAQSGHTTRRMRRIEIVFDGITQLGQVRVLAGSTVRPWPFAGPRLMVMQDSYGQVFADRPGGQWPYRVAGRLGIEDVWLNAIGGTGFTAGTRPYLDRLGEVAAHLPPAGRPLVFVTQGSINDAGATAADLRAATQAFWTAAFAALPPDAVMVQTGILRAPGNNPADALAAAVRDGFAAVCAVADPAGLRSGFVETRAPLEMMTVGGRAGAITGTGATDFWISGDAAHPTQAGHDHIGDAFAAALLGILRRG